jgi:hypothetical protein
MRSAAISSPRQISEMRPKPRAWRPLHSRHLRSCRRSHQATAGHGAGQSSARPTSADRVRGYPYSQEGIG